MTNRSDMDRILQVWMADGPAAIPDRVVDVVAARIAVNSQRRRAWPFQGRTNMTTQIKLIAGLAAVLVIAVVGYSLLLGTAGPGGPTAAPTQSAEPTPAATTAPTPGPTGAARWPEWFSPGAIRDANGAGILSPGIHASIAFRPGFIFRVPDGWVNAYDEPDYFTLFKDTPANQAGFAETENPAQHIFMGFPGSPWFTCEALENNTGPTAAEIVKAMEAAEVLDVSRRVEPMIGGLKAIQVDVRRDPDWTGTCSADSGLPAAVDPIDERTRAILLDVPDRGVLVVFLYSMSSADIEAFLVEAMRIVESFLFNLGQ